MNEEALLRGRIAELRAALEALCTPPEGSEMPTGQHDHGRHFAAYQAAWQKAFEALRGQP